jgi:hypothetical protein
VPTMPQLPRRWRSYLIVSGAVLAISMVVDFGWLDSGPSQDVEITWAVLGILVGIGLAGLWAPQPPSEPPSAPEEVAGQPFGKLGRALLPLTLPLVIVLIAGTVEYPWYVAPAAGLIGGLFAWAAVVRGEMDELKWSIGSGPGPLDARWRWCGFAAIGLAAFIFGLWPALVSHSEPGYLAFEERGGWSGGLFRGAILLLVVAVLLRFVSFATSRVRLAQAIALLLLLGYLALSAGLIGSDGMIEWANERGAGLFLALAAGTLLLEVVLEAIALFVKPAEKRGRFRAAIRGHGLPENATNLFGGYGLGTALLAALTLGIAIVVGLSEARDRDAVLAGGAATQSPQVAPRAQADAATGDELPQALVNTYMPVLAFRSDQRWLPQTVAEYMPDVQLNRLNGPEPETPIEEWNQLQDPERREAALGDLPCPATKPSPCYRLLIRDCDPPNEECEGGYPDGVGEGALSPPARSGAVYVRVVDRKQLPDFFPANEAFPAGPLRDLATRTTILLQYWYFYRYDEWKTPTLLGNLVQRHEGDWEAVTVGLGDDQPLFVGYSQHCHGQWRYWDHVRAAVAPVPRTHPLVAVARGSQANYAVATQRRSPDWANCSGHPKGIATLVSYASNIRDLTAYEYGWEPAVTLRADQRFPPMSFPGYWGNTGHLILETQTEHTLDDGGEPKSPSMQALWRYPLRTILCSWDGPSGDSGDCPKKFVPA